MIGNGIVDIGPPRGCIDTTANMIFDSDCGAAATT